MHEFFERAHATAVRVKQQEPLIHGFELSGSSTRSFQRLYAFEASRGLYAHQTRQVIDQGCGLTLYVAVGEGLGLASATLVPHQDLEEQIRYVMELALQTTNQAWPLAKPPAEAYPEVLTHDPEILADPEAAFATIEAQVREEAQKDPELRLNSAELYLNLRELARVTSTGISTSKTVTDLYFEAAFERAGRENDQEVHEMRTGVMLADLKIPEFFRRCGEQVRGLTESVEPPTEEQAVIVVHADVISQFVEALREHAAASRRYMDYPCFKVGDLVADKPADQLNLSVDPLIPGMAASSAYTADGLAARGGVFLAKGRVAEDFVDQRFGHYLGREPNRLAGNSVLEPGKAGCDELFQSAPRRMDILTFSSLLIDEDTLTWSSEIKLARLYAPDGSFRLVKGGVASGNLKQNFSDALFSSETERINFPGTSYHGARGYLGPECMLIKSGVSIAGRTGATE
jgi:predicted Zn-dependent protease